MERKNKQNFDAIKLRLLQFAEIQHIPKVEFYEKIEMRQSNFAGKCAESALKSDNIVKVLMKYPELNPDWLLLGMGEMLRPGRLGETTMANGNSVALSGNDIANSGNVTNVSDRLLDLLSAQQKTIDAQQKTIDRLSDTIDGLFHRLAPQ